MGLWSVGGRNRVIYAFIGTLSFSRLPFLRFYTSQDQVAFYKTNKLLERLAPERISARRGQILLKRCLASALLILDDFAFRAYSQRETELLYTSYSY